MNKPHIYSLGVKQTGGNDRRLYRTLSTSSSNFDYIFPGIPAHLLIRWQCPATCHQPALAFLLRRWMALQQEKLPLMKCWMSFIG